MWKQNKKKGIQGVSYSWGNIYKRLFFKSDHKVLFWKSGPLNNQKWTFLFCYYSVYSRLQSHNRQHASYNEPWTRFWPAPRRSAPPTTSLMARSCSSFRQSTASEARVRRHGGREKRSEGRGGLNGGEEGGARGRGVAVGDEIDPADRSYCRSACYLSTLSRRLLDAFSFLPNSVSPSGV